MTAKLNEKLEFLRSGSEQDLLKEFKKNKALIKRLGTVRKKFDEVFEEAKERARLDNSRKGDNGIIMFHDNPELIFEFLETIQKMKIEVDYQKDELVLGMFDTFGFKSEPKTKHTSNDFEMVFPGYRIKNIMITFPENTNPKISDYINKISKNLDDIEENFIMEDRTFYYSPFEKDERKRVCDSIRSMINNQGNISSLLYKYRPSIVTVRITLSVDKDGKLFVTNNKNRTTILDFNLFVVSNTPHFIVNAIDPDINNDFFDYTFGKISEDDFLLKLIKIFKKEAKKVLS
jgi:hypothetical protein